jgi:hypothetical protein
MKMGGIAEIDFCTSVANFGGRRMFIHSELSIADVLICCKPPFYETNEVKGSSASLA